MTPNRGLSKPWVKVSVRHSLMACALSALLAPFSGFSSSNDALAAKNKAPQQVTNRERKSPKLKLPPAGVAMDVVAENMTYDSNTRVAVATGDVFVSYQDYRLRADKVIYDRKNGKLRAIGNVWWREQNGNVITGDDVFLDDDFANGFGNYMRWMLTDGSTITSTYTKRVDGSITYFTQATYTRCQTCVTDSGRPLWQLNAEEAEYIEDDNRIHYYNTTMEMFGIPIFWLPWISYPDPQTKRASGFLAPSFKFSDVYGFGVETPYFWNLAPNYDITFLPVWNVKQGIVPRAVWRHDVGDGQYWVDASGVRQLDRDFPPPGDKKWRGAIRSQGQIELSRHWDWGWKAVATSDKTYLKRYSIDGSNDLINTAYLTGLNDRNYFSAETYNYKSALSQIDNNTLPSVLPYIQHYFKFDDPVLGGELGIDTNVYSLWRDRSLATSITPTGIVGQGTQATRASTELHWQRQIITNGGVQFTPFGRVRADFYSNNNVVDTSVPTGERGKEQFARVMPLGGMDMRWPIISSNSIGQHIFTPAAQIIAGTNETDIEKISNEDSVVLDFDDTNLFLHNRFTGNDRYEGGTRANLGLIYTYLMDNGGFAKFSVGESFHLAGRNSFLKGSGLNTKNSDIVVATAMQFNQYLRLSYTGRFENKNLNANRHEVGARFSYESLTTAVNYGNVDPALAYGRDERRHQIWGNAKYSFDNGWSVFAGSRYDLETKKFVRSAAGFAFDCDCYNMRVTFVQNNTEDLDVLKQFSVLFSIEFKTLGGGQISRVVNEGER